jgi:hypothetical protein
MYRRDLHTPQLVEPLALASNHNARLSPREDIRTLASYIKDIGHVCGVRM